MAKLRLKKRRPQPKKKATVQRELSSSRDGSSSYDSRSCSSYAGTDDCSYSRTLSSSPESSSGEDIREYKKGGYHPVEIFQLYAGRFRVLGKLGSGAFSTVWLCADEKAKELELVAMKICKSSRSVCEQTLDEVKLLDALDSSFTMTLKTHFWHSGPNGNHKCLIFELMGENLLSIVRHFNDEGLPLSWVKKIAHDTLQSLAHCHSRQVIHTDIKLENVLIMRHDLPELLHEAEEALSILRKRNAILAKRKVVVDTSNMTKSKKKRLKKKQKKKAATGGAGAVVTEGAALEESALVAETGAAPDSALADEKTEEAEKAEPEIEGEEEELPPLPTPPSRQKSRLDSLRLSDLHCKLTDFGNGCWTDKHFTEEIQTRQYRSPEALLGQTYNESTDMWSAACMFFELITGEFLFAPRSSKKWSRDEDHISLIIELLGTYPPAEWALKGRYGKNILSNDGAPKKIKKLKFWSLYDVLCEKYEMDVVEAQEFCDFLLPMLEWLPENRITAEEALKHPWLKGATDEDENDLSAAAYIRQKSADGLASDSSREDDRDDVDSGVSDHEGDKEEIYETPMSSKPRAEAKASPAKDEKTNFDVNEKVREADVHISPQCLPASELRDDEFH